MAAMTSIQLPPLHNLAYPIADTSDHAGGGHCVGLPDDDVDQWQLLLDQHLRAFNEVADRGREQLAETGDGWALTRPVLFAAHHTCEVAIKLALVAHTGKTGPNEHALDVLWARLASQGGATLLDPAQTAWATTFIAQMQKLTIKGFDGRYPNTPGDLSGQWCCLNMTALQSAVRVFVAVLRP